MAVFFKGFNIILWQWLFNDIFFVILPILSYCYMHHFEHCRCDLFCLATSFEFEFVLTLIFRTMCR